MTGFLFPLEQLNEPHRPRVGGKAFSLAVMQKNGFRVPAALCVTTQAYEHYIASTGLKDQIILDLHRKPFAQMRWEEVWDTALRIRNAFLRTAVPADLRESLLKEFQRRFSTRPVSVRSSAPGEDSAKTSFAGLHESFVNIRGPEAILDHVRLVWASLWSDRALLYRRETGLDVENSAMAVIVQEMILGDRSGIVFGRSPTDNAVSVVEAVYGLNEGLVDGAIEPDQWRLDRHSGRILSHVPVRRQKAVRAAENGTSTEILSSELQRQPPLAEREVLEVHGLCMRSEALFAAPQDMEWTYRGKDLYALQSRPITTAPASTDDERPWYLSLHRSLENLKELRGKIEDELLPEMEAEAGSLAQLHLQRLSDASLADEIENRRLILQKWKDVYRNDCIPFAHGMRLFGQVYNDRIRPDDPFEFVELLSETGMVSTRRNGMLAALADRIRGDGALSECLRNRPIADCDPAFQAEFNDLIFRFGDIAWNDNRFVQDAENLLSFLMEMAASPFRASGSRDTARREQLHERFLSAFPADERPLALEMLEIGRASYRLRDDDNIYLGKIEGQLLSAIQEGKARLARNLAGHGQDIHSADVPDMLRGQREISTPPALSSREMSTPAPRITARQIVGQPAGPGLATGKARVVSGHSELFAFKRGEILVCDAIDPGMTFVIPLAAAVVERRGGMLIHGAIIAREYGLPCVTGVPEATRWIRTGDPITVDGYLGMVIIGEPVPGKEE